VAVYIGTATPSDYKLGSNAVSKIYLGSTQVWPVAATALLEILRDNGATSSFSGVGTSASRYSRATDYYYNDANGVLHYSWRLSGPGTVYMSCNCVDENDSGQTFSFKKNGSAFATSSNGGQNGFASSASGQNGDVFTIVSNAGSGNWSVQLIGAVSVYAT